MIQVCWGRRRASEVKVRTSSLPGCNNNQPLTAEEYLYSFGMIWGDKVLHYTYLIIEYYNDVDWKCINRREWYNAVYIKNKRQVIITLDFIILQLVLSKTIYDQYMSTNSSLTFLSFPFCVHSIVSFQCWLVFIYSLFLLSTMQSWYLIHPLHTFFLLSLWYIIATATNPW